MWSPQQNTIPYSLSCKIPPETLLLCYSLTFWLPFYYDSWQVTVLCDPVTWATDKLIVKYWCHQNSLALAVLWMPTARFTREESRIGYSNRNVACVSCTYWGMKMARYLGHQESLFGNICHGSSEGLEEEASLSCSCGFWYRLLFDPVPWIASWGALGIPRDYL